MAESKTSKKSNAPKKFQVVGIGASAGGLEAIRDLLKALPADTGMGFVIVQHLDPTRESLAPEILTRITSMPVEEVRRSQQIKPNHVYLIPPNFDLTICRGILSLLPFKSEKKGQRLAIDLFLQSLARDQSDSSIGIVLSGTAKDGTQGLKAIRSAGGLTIAQDPKTAKYPGMPESAISSGFVDLILSPVEIARELARVSKLQLGTNADHEISSETNECLRQIFTQLREFSHIDFTHYKHSTIMRRIGRRMVERKSETLRQYAKYIEEHPEEVKTLYADILIHVTEFFRDPKSFQFLKDEVFPKLVKNRKPDATIRVWVAGCSTGQEAYSIAIVLQEFLNQGALKFPIQIFATDISDRAIHKARVGIYPLSIESTVSQERLDLFFERVDAGYKVKKNIRDICLFSKHDVTNDTPFSRLDLISCRNVLIYFASALQKKVMPLFHYALSPNGFLLLGKSESLSGLSKLFSSVDKTHKVYAKSIVSPAAKSAHSKTVFRRGLQEAAKELTPEKNENSLKKDVERATLSRYAPPSVIVNANMDILHFQGRIKHFLEPMAGQASLNLFKMIRSELVPILRKAVLLATTKNAPVRQENLIFEIEGSYVKINIEVVPLNPLASGELRNLIIFFEEVTQSLKRSAPKGRIEKTSAKNTNKKTSWKDQGERIRLLMEELSAKEQAQRSLTEEFETSQEELTATNEELQSTNEELQSSNEELETSKEELQSSNEELTTVNEELQIRNEDLHVLSSDLSNVLSNVEIPIVIVGGDRHIRRFTPKAEKIFNLIATDVGRPLSDIQPNFESDLGKMVSNAIFSLSSQECEVKLPNEQWMRLQVRPYRAVDDRIEGAVITLIDITTLKENLSISQTALKYATSVADTLALPLVVLDEQLHVLSANVEFFKMFNQLDANQVGSDFMAVLAGTGFNHPELANELSKVLGSTDYTLKDFEIEHDFRTIGHRIMLLNARKINWKSTMPKALLLSIEDITDRRTLERALEHSEERFRAVVESAHTAIIIVNSAGFIEFANPKTIEWFGYPIEELEGMRINTLISGQSQAAWVEGSRPGARLESFEVNGKRKDGSDIPLEVSVSPIKSGGENRMTVIIRDISESKRLSDERRVLLEQEKEATAKADRANATKDLFLATLSHELRTPLSSILSWAQLIQRESFPPDRLKHGIQAIEQSARTQGQLIDDLLDVARIQSGKLSINFAEIDPSEMIRLALDAVLPLAEKKSITFKTKINIGLAKVWGDSDRLQQVVWNLLTNAIKFSSVQSEIQVLVEQVDCGGKAFVSIRVIDSGKGIKPEFLPRLFERFSQADSSSVRVHGGLGLGLALVSDLSRLHGGSVQAESDGLGKGSRFTVLLPVKSEFSEEAVDSEMSGRTKKKEKTERPNLGGTRVLIVEDQPATREVLYEILISFGATVMACASVSDALAAFGGFKPCVLISDIAMPVEDGYDLIRKVRKLGRSRNGNIPSIALTAYATEVDKKRALSAGFDLHMTKPFDNFGLGHAVAKLAHTSGQN